MSNCRETSKNKEFIFEEKRSKLTLKNSNEVYSTKIKVDGCEIKGDTKRCDFMLTTDKLEIYIELKGTDISKAIIQIESTIGKLGSNNSIPERKAYIICTRVPLASTEIQILALKLKKNFNANLIVKSSPYTDKY